MKEFLHHLTRTWKAWLDNRYVRATLTAVRQLFITLLTTYLLLLLVEAVWPDSVARFLNLNYWLVAVIVTGVITVLSPKEAATAEKKALATGDIVTLVCLGIGGAVLIWYRSREIGWLAYIVAVAGGALIVLLSLLVWGRNRKEEREGEDSPDS